VILDGECFQSHASRSCTGNGREYGARFGPTDAITRRKDIVGRNVLGEDFISSDNYPSSVKKKKGDMGRRCKKRTSEIYISMKVKGKKT
jgi:hypothetical protein